MSRPADALFVLALFAARLTPGRSARHSKKDMATWHDSDTLSGRVSFAPLGPLLMPVPLPEPEAAMGLSAQRPKHGRKGPNLPGSFRPFPDLRPKPFWPPTPEPATSPKYVQLPKPVQEHAPVSETLPLTPAPGGPYFDYFIPTPVPTTEPMPSMPWPRPPLINRPPMPFRTDEEVPMMSNQEFWQYLVAGESRRNGHSPQTESKETTFWQDHLVASAENFLEHLHWVRETLMYEAVDIEERISELETEYGRIRLNFTLSEMVKGPQALEPIELRVARRQLSEKAHLEERIVNAIVALEDAQEELVSAKGGLRAVLLQQEEVRNATTIHEQALVAFARQLEAETIIIGSQPAVQNVIKGNLATEDLERFGDFLTSAKQFDVLPEDAKLSDAEEHISLLVSDRKLLKEFDEDVSDYLDFLRKAELGMSRAVEKARERIMEYGSVIP